jgi:hypothetical protein
MGVSQQSKEEEVVEVVRLLVKVSQSKIKSLQSWLFFAYNSLLQVEA